MAHTATAWLFSILALFAFVATGCGDDGDDPTDTVDTVLLDTTDTTTADLVTDIADTAYELEAPADTQDDALPVGVESVTVFDTMATGKTARSVNKFFGKDMPPDLEAFASSTTSPATYTGWVGDEVVAQDVFSYLPHLETDPQWVIDYAYVQESELSGGTITFGRKASAPAHVDTGTPMERAFAVADSAASILEYLLLDINIAHLYPYWHAASGSTTMVVDDNMLEALVTANSCYGVAISGSLAKIQSSTDFAPVVTTYTDRHVATFYTLSVSAGLCDHTVTFSRSPEIAIIGEKVECMEDYQPDCTP